MRVHAAGGMHGTFTLDGVRATIAGHALHALTGPVTIVPDGFGQRRVSMRLLDDGTPVAAVGEVHDGGDWSAHRDVRGRAICARSRTCSR